MTKTDLKKLGLWAEEWRRNDTMDSVGWNIEASDNGRDNLKLDERDAARKGVEQFLDFVKYKLTNHERKRNSR